VALSGWCLQVEVHENSWQGHQIHEIDLLYAWLGKRSCVASVARFLAQSMHLDSMSLWQPRMLVQRTWSHAVCPVQRTWSHAVCHMRHCGSSIRKDALGGLP
jgi:hypothetical protein